MGELKNTFLVCEQAICTKTGPGTNNCSCDFGFEGDGIFCKAIDPCVASERGGCHANADCLFTGPGRVSGYWCFCKIQYSTYLLLAECEVRTTSYETSFFLDGESREANKMFIIWFC